MLFLKAQSQMISRLVLKFTHTLNMSNSESSRKLDPITGQDTDSDLLSESESSDDLSQSNSMPAAESDGYCAFNTSTEYPDSPWSSDSSSDLDADQNISVGAGPQQSDTEKIVPLINSCRKICGCDQEQLSEWISDSKFFGMIKAFKSWALIKKMLLKSICFYHAEISSNIFESLLASLPDEKELNDLNDSITKSRVNNDEDDDLEQEQEPLTLLKISGPLKKLCFDYLNVVEMAQIQQTCRSLNISSRDPNETGTVFHIRCCRKIEVMNKEQIIEYITEFIKIFKNENALDLVKKMMIKSLCFYRADIPLDTFECLLSSSPNENELIDLDDSITKSDLNEEEDEEREPLTLLQIPKALKVLCFNYLRERELVTVQKVCRCLCIAARDPNSLYYLHSWMERDYRHPWDSRIKSLKIGDHYRMQFNFNRKWGQGVICLESQYHCDSIPYFENLSVCSLRCEATKLFENHINYATLRKLELLPVGTFYWIGILQCVNLEQLCLKPCSHRSRYGLRPPTDEEYIQKMMSKLESKPFHKLKLFETNYAMFTLLPSLFYLILSNRKSKTSLDMDIDKHELKHCDLFPKDSKLAVCALENVNNLKLTSHKNEAISSLFFNLYESILRIRNHNFGHFEFDFSSMKKFDCLSTPILNELLSNFKQCRLKLYSYQSYWDRGWAEDQMAIRKNDLAFFDNFLKTKTFDFIKINMECDHFKYWIQILFMENSYKSCEHLLSSKGFKQYASEILEQFDIWYSKLILFTPQKMKEIQIKEIEFEFGFDCDFYIDADTDDPECYMDQDQYVTYEEYEQAFEQKRKESVDVWQKWAKPSLLEMFAEKYLNSPSVVCISDEDGSVFDIKMKITKINRRRPLFATSDS